MLWIAYVDRYHHQPHGDDAAVENLVRVIEKKKLSARLKSLRKVPQVQHRAHALKRALANYRIEGLKLIFRMWLEAKARPDQPFHTMVEIDETRPTGAEIKPAWQSAFQGGIKLWFKYNGDFNRKYRKEDPFDSNSVVELMVNKKGTEETAAILVSLRNISPSMEDLAGTCQKELALQYPESVKMVPMWLHYDTDPIEVYHLMPIKEKDILILGVGDRTEWEDISQKLRQWLHYVDEFNGKMIAKMTADVSNLEDLVAFVQYLEPTGGMDSFVTLMETLLISESPTAEQAMFESWAKSGVSPQVLYPKTYLGLAHWGRFASGATESELPEYFCVMLKQFLLYVDMYREHGYVFGDKAVIGLLLERRDPQTLQDRLEYFGTVRDQKERLNELLAALHAWAREHLAT